jgi:hypothetical protein
MQYNPTSTLVTQNPIFLPNGEIEIESSPARSLDFSIPNDTPTFSPTLTSQPLSTPRLGPPFTLVPLSPTPPFSNTDAALSISQSPSPSDQLDWDPNLPIGFNRIYISRLFTSSLQGIKKNLKPALSLQLLAIIILLLYYLNDSFQSFLDSISQLKERNDVLFSAISTAIFGGIFPFTFEVVTKQC